MTRITTLLAGCLTGAASLAASATLADSVDIVLETPMAAQSLHTDNVDLVAFYLDTGNGLELTVTYIAKDKPAEPQRMQMLLLEGDRVTFALPCLPETTYVFARKGETISIDAQPVLEPIEAARMSN